MAEPILLGIERLATPLGELMAVTDAAGLLYAVDWTEHEAAMRRHLRLYYPPNVVETLPRRRPSVALASLEAYFSGELAAIEKLPVAVGGTPFQAAVWRALRKIRCGETLSYAALARRIGRPSARRAVGLANGANPISIVVPCHRVIGSDGTLTGYGGGLGRKRWLLAHEGVELSPGAAIGHLEERQEALQQLQG